MSNFPKPSAPETYQSTAPMVPLACCATATATTLRPAGTISGPTLMALADCAMYVVLLSAIGPVGLAVTTNLSINFLRKGQPGQDVLAAARLLKLGKRLAVGEVNLLSGTLPDPIAHAISTYSIPNTYGFLR